MYRFLGRSVLIGALVAVTGVSALAQKAAEVRIVLVAKTAIGTTTGWSATAKFREQTLAMSGAPIAIDGRQNGGVSVKGWDQNQVLVRARVQTGAPTAEEAAALGRQITNRNQRREDFREWS